MSQFHFSNLHPEWLFSPETGNHRSLVLISTQDIKTLCRGLAVSKKCDISLITEDRVCQWIEFFTIRWNFTLLYLQNLHQTALIIFQMWNSAWNKLQFKVCQVANASVAYLDKHSTLDIVMVSVVSSIPLEAIFWKFLNVNVNVNFGLKM